MATFNKFNCFARDLMRGYHDVRAAGDTFKVYASNAAPSASDDSVKTDLAEISAENGYPSGGSDIQNDESIDGGTASMTGVDVVWTATVGGFGPLRYIPLYNDTSSGATDPLAGWWDYGSPISVAEGETFTVDFGTTVLDVA